MSVRFKVHLKILLKWKRESRFWWTKSKSSEMSLAIRTESSLTAKRTSRLKSSKEILWEQTWTRTSSFTKTGWASSVKKLTKVTSWTWSSTPYRKRWTIWFSNMKWLVSLETTWVSNWLIKMMSFVSFTKRATSKRTFWKTVSKKSDKRKRRSEWSTWNLKRDRDNLSLSGSKFQRSHN